MEDNKSTRSDTTIHASLPSIKKADLYEDEGSVDPVYQAKAHVLNQAIQEIGMGKYQVRLFPKSTRTRYSIVAQWALFVVSGFGWFSDSVWPLMTGLILSPVVNEFGFTSPFLSLSANIGLLVGAVLWSFGCDIWGRRLVALSSMHGARLTNLTDGHGTSLYLWLLSSVSHREALPTSLLLLC